MAVECYIGPKQTCSTPHRLMRIDCAFRTRSSPTKRSTALKTISERGWRSKVIDITWPRSEGPDGLEPALERIRQEAEGASTKGTASSS